MYNVDVVIISWAKTKELYDITWNGLSSLFGCKPTMAYHAYVVESNPDVTYDQFNSDVHTCTTIHPTTEFGYNKYLNIGRRLGKSEYVVLCNNDLTYDCGWAANIIREMNKDADLLSASPWCPQIHRDRHKKGNVGNCVYGYSIITKVTGWCIFQKRKIYDLLGDLDERFVFWYSDNDYCMTIREKGIKHALVINSWVEHHGKRVGKTADNVLSKEKLRTYTSLQKKIFLNKWKNINNILVSPKD